MIKVYSVFRFLLEVSSVLSVGYWGFQLRSLGVWRFVIGIAAPALVVLVWALWGAPSATHRLQGVRHLLLELTVNLTAIVCLYSSGRKVLAAIYGVLAVINALVHYFWFPAI